LIDILNLPLSFNNGVGVAHRHGIWLGDLRAGVRILPPATFDSGLQKNDSQVGLKSSVMINFAIIV